MELIFSISGRLRVDYRVPRTTDIPSSSNVRDNQNIDLMKGTIMAEITQSETRKIIDDFADEIRQRLVKTAKPSMEVINFRTDIRDGKERPIDSVPIGLLRYRKDNGRIASDVADYERKFRPLDETSREDQALLAKFLYEKDPEKTSILRSTLLHEGQRKPAIITCDGFLINGNRRKMVMDRLHTEHPDDDRFTYMKVVILPSQSDQGGPPTLLEIEKIENRYQLQRDGKSEYYGFDRALSIRRKMQLGFSLEEQLRDDPQFAKATKKELQKAITKYTKDYLRPLECVDRYLKQFRREGQYRSISTGISDKEGRWQAFTDYSNTYYGIFQERRRLVEFGIEEDEVGTIEEAAFDIIRLRVIPDMPTVHDMMRRLPKYCRTPVGKRSILKICDEVPPVLPPEEHIDESGEPLKSAEVDAKWAAKNGRSIIHHVKKAAIQHDTTKEKETPLELMEAAYKKLTHANMDLTAIALSDLDKARAIVVKIRGRLDELESEIYHHKKTCKKVSEKLR